jgi:hypothetical protein
MLTRSHLEWKGGRRVLERIESGAYEVEIRGSSVAGQ